MNVLKIFHETPAALGASFDAGATGEAFLAALQAAPRYHRLYLSGTVGAGEGHAAATGLSALPEAAWRPALAAALGVDASALETLRANDLRILIPVDAPRSGAASDSLAAALRTAAPGPPRLAALRAVLDAGRVVVEAEAAPDGFDLHAFAPFPVFDAFVAALPPRPPGLRRVAGPFRQLRSEARFYFERWGDGLAPPPGLVEV